MQTISLILSPKDSVDEQAIWRATVNQLQLPSLGSLRVVRRSVDARQRNIKVTLTVEAFAVDEDPTPRYEPPHYKDVSKAKHQVVIVGAGPAGLFAALTLIEHGIRPIVLDRGKEVSERKKDIALLNRNEGLNPESNYCFGEGGAGTFSDGKLFSRSKKRGEMQRVMEIFHYFGAEENVLYEAHAHIGSDRLPSIIRRMRETIIEYGGEVHYETKITSLCRDACECVSEDGRHFTGDAIILAIGHSAHDTYHMLAASGVRLEAKGFAMGVRVEYPQSLINDIMYHGSKDAARYLGNASYSLVTQVEGRGVYSFCMCPGGHIVPAGSETDGCVVNGMSASHRNSPYANSGIVVEIRPEDTGDALTCASTQGMQGGALTRVSTQRVQGDALTCVSTQVALAALSFQEYLERLAKENGAEPSKAPAQRLRDFVEGRESKSLPSCSYLPGIVPSRMDKWLPLMIGKRLQQGFRDFDRKHHGLLTNDAVIVGVESRSSSPVRIPRNRETMQHPDFANLYPIGEGAGYAGGITSSALDGINAAKQISERLSLL